MEQTTSMAGFASSEDIDYLQQRIVEASEMIRESCVERDSLQASNCGLQLENDRLQLVVEQKKTACALLEEKKAENELRMKKEIKFLLQHLTMQRDDDESQYSARSHALSS